MTSTSTQSGTAPVTAAASSGVPPLDRLLLEVADVVNTTLDLDTTLRRVAEVVRKIVDFEIFAILLLNEKQQELYIKFSIGYMSEVAERARVRVGEGVTGLAAERREAVLVNDTTTAAHYIDAVPNVRSELALPLIVKNKVIGVIDIESPIPNHFTEEHKQVLTLIASRVAVHIENARLYTRTSRQAKTLLLLNEIARELTSILNLDDVLKRVGELLNRVLDYQMFSILLVDPTGEKLQHRFALRYQENVQLKHDVPMGRGLVGYAAQTGEAVLVPDVKKDPRYFLLNPETRSELAVPLIYKERVIGVLDLEHVKRNFFNEEHKRTITTLAAQIAIAIENARLYEQIARQEKRLERDLALARELQFRLLPPAVPKLANLEVAARSISARQIGGDFYDFLNYSAGRTAFVVGDVSGKGAPAAIYAALVSGILRSHAPMEPGAAEMLSAINLSLGERRIEAQFVSIICAVWDDARRTLLLANSGLPRPVFCRNGKVQIIEATGLPLGLFEEADYDEFTFQAKPGDLFVFFSDGILDATGKKGELFGREGVEAIIAQSGHKSAAQVMEAINKAVGDYSKPGDAFDDQTVVVLKVREDGAKDVSKKDDGAKRK